MLEVPVHFDLAIRVLFAYVQSAAFLSFCKTWSFSLNPPFPLTHLFNMPKI